MSDNLRVRGEPWPFTFSVDALAPWQTYAVAIGATTAILGVRLRLGGSFEGQSALAMFTIPIMLSAFLGGLGPGLLATALSSVLAAYYLSPPIHSLAIASVTGRWQLFFVALAGVFITTLNEGLHRARRRAESATLAHQHAEAEVRASEQKLRQVIDGLGPEVFLGLMTPDGILVEANRPGLQAAGVRADEVLGKRFDQTYWWGHSEAAREQLRATMVRAAAGEPSRYDVQVRVSGDALVWVDFSVNPVLDADGRVIYLVPSAAVIDDRIRAEEALFQAGALQRAIFNSANFSSIATDAEGVIQIFNVGAERMLGYAAAEVVNTITPTWIFDPQEVVARATALSLEFATTVAPGFEALVFKASRGIEDIHEMTCIRKDRSRFHAVVSVTALRDAQDAIIGYLLIGTDNTIRRQTEEARHLAEEARRTSDARYHALFDCAPDGILIADAGSNYLDSNGSMCRMLGYSRDEVIGMHASNIVAASELAHIGPALDSLAATSLHEREWRFRRKDASEFDADVIATQMPDGNLLAMVRDITERKRVQLVLQQKNAELEAASRLKSEFLANMSHELRTPLNAIIGFSEVLGDGMLGELTVQQRTFIADIFSSGNHLLALINDILDLSKVEAGKMMLDLEVVPVAGLLDKSLRIIREQASAHRIRLEIDTAEAPPSITADSRKVTQIVYNLLSNAVKFSTDGGHVILRAARVTRDDIGRRVSSWPSRDFPLVDNPFTEFVEISVTDRGLGISRQGMQSLFTPFSQIDGGLARRFEGTGLGLAMVRRLVELHGGTLAVESALGEGSRFVVWLPLRAREEGPAFLTRSLAGEGHLPDADTRTALVVEDDFKAAELIRFYLEAEGFKVLHAASAEAALALALRESLSLITLDLLLPHMDGWEFLARLKQMADLGRVPVVIISILAERNKGFACGAAAVMQKPVSRQELSESLLDLGLVPVAPGRTLKVLIVDDDPRAVELIAVQIGSLGGPVVRAHGGAAAIAAARRDPPDVIVLDLMMPETNGFDVVKSLALQPDTACIPVLVVTAKGITVEDHIKLQGYVTAIMEKTEFDPGHFAAEVRRAMRHHQGVA